MRAKKQHDSLANIRRTNEKNKNKRAKPKYQYICKLALYNGKLEGASSIDYDKESDYLKDARLLKCNPEWPLCLFDHTYKSRCVSYFAFRAKSDNEFIDDYLIKKPSLNQSNGVKEEHKKGSLEAYNALVIERSKHYCGNRVFVEKLKRLLEEKGTPDDAFRVDLIDQTAINHDICLKLMKKYVRHIVDFEESSPISPLPPSKKTKEEDVHLSRKNSDKNEEVDVENERNKDPENILRARVEKEVDEDDSRDEEKEEDYKDSNIPIESAVSALEKVRKNEVIRKHRKDEDYRLNNEGIDENENEDEVITGSPDT